MSTASPAPADTFTHRFIPAFGKRVHRLGLATSYGIDEAGVRAAFAAGMNYVFCPQGAKAGLTDPLREALQKDRERLVVATGPSLGFFGGSVRRCADKMRDKLGTDYLDLFQLHWLGKTSAWTESTVTALQALKQAGQARAIGVSIHDRPRAGRLAADSPLDALMIRYNASHPGAERDIFPHCEKRRPVIIAYTATDWRKLLTRPSDYSGPVPTAGDCYRFCLSSPHVDLVLCGPASERELNENLQALEKGPLSAEEMTWMREFGRRVYGKGLVNQK
jgi:aryl-alcohol dehydrogenase-like predicted oxidoreductase